MPSPYCAQERGRVGSVPGEQTGVRGGPPRTLQGRLLFLLDVPQIGVTAALINTNLRLASLLHCVTVGNCKVTRGRWTCMSKWRSDRGTAQGIIFDYSLAEAVAEVIGELRSGQVESSISFQDPPTQTDFSCFHLACPSPLTSSPLLLPVSGSVNLDLAVRESTEAPVPR